MGDYFIEADFQAGSNGDDIRNIWRREGSRLRIIGRIWNKSFFQYWSKCKTRGPEWNPRLTPLSEYMTPAEFASVTYEESDVSLRKKLKYNPFGSSF
jgi:hypothetical protein